MTADILVVDDERDIRSLISMTLTDEGYVTKQAAGAAEARNLLLSQPPKLAILDIWMRDSDMDGLELLEWSKSIYPDLPILMISGHFRKKDRKNVIKCIFQNRTKIVLNRTKNQNIDVYNYVNYIVSNWNEVEREIEESNPFTYIKRNLEFIENTNNKKLILLHCKSVYPPSDEYTDLNNIDLLKESFNYDNWIIMDIKRLGYNSRNDHLFSYLNICPLILFNGAA